MLHYSYIKWNAELTLNYCIRMIRYYNFSPSLAYCTMSNSYRTFGLLTQLCLPLLQHFLMAVAFLVRTTYLVMTCLVVLVFRCVDRVWLPLMYISALLCALGTLSEFSSVPILVTDGLAHSSSCESRS